MAPLNVSIGTSYDSLKKLAIAVDCDEKSIAVSRREKIIDEISAWAKEAGSETVLRETDEVINWYKSASVLGSPTNMQIAIVLLLFGVVIGVLYLSAKSKQRKAYAEDLRKLKEILQNAALKIEQAYQNKIEELEKTYESYVAQKQQICTDSRATFFGKMR